MNSPKCLERLPQDLTDEVRTLYGQNGLPYHNWSHILAGLHEIDLWNFAAAKPAPDVALLAFLGHDLVCVPGRQDNEIKSAILFGQILGRHGFGRYAGRVHEIITHTALGMRPKNQDHAATLVRDADLAVLGYQPSAYARYAGLVRKEYRHVPDAAYKKRRLAVLTMILGMSPIFQTPYFRERYETQAIRNIRREIQLLG